MVSQFLIGMGASSPRSLFNSLTGTPNPIAPPDFMERMAITFPFKSRAGLPLLPGSMGMATWTIGLPSPNSSSRIAAITPRLTECSYPRGLPIDKTACPGIKSCELPSWRTGNPFTSILIRARSRSRSIARIECGRKVRPSVRRTEKSRCSPITWKLVAITPSSRTTNPVPRPPSYPLRSTLSMTTTDGFIRVARFLKSLASLLASSSSDKLVEFVSSATELMRQLRKRNTSLG